MAISRTGACISLAANLLFKFIHHPDRYRRRLRCLLVFGMLTLVLQACSSDGSSGGAENVAAPDNGAETNNTPINSSNGNAQSSPTSSEAGADLLSVTGANNLPTRMKQGVDERLYVSDAAAGSVFIYSSDLVLSQEIKNIDMPLGIALREIPEPGIVVGSDGKNRIEIYDMDGQFVMSFGEAEIQMPSDIIIDDKGAYYIADSKSDKVWKYDVDGKLIGSIGTPGAETAGGLRFPSALCLATRNNQSELFVADPGNGRIQVFDLSGQYLRGFGTKLTHGSEEWQGRFGRPQSLIIDGQDRLHVVDTYLHMVQIVNPDSGEYIDSYGGFGKDKGKLRVPLDIEIMTSGAILITDSGNSRIEKL